MTTQAVAASIEQVVVDGDLSRLTPTQRLEYYSRVCESLGLNPMTRPFDYLKLNGKVVLYARKDATDQIRKIHGVSITELTHELVEDIIIVTAAAQDASGRRDISKGAVSLAGLKGEALANAYMKAESKAKRRVTLSLCGLGMLDETEVGTIPDAMPATEVAVYPDDTTPPPEPATPSDKKAPYWRFLAKCQELKKELGESRYFGVLEKFGLQHSNEVGRGDIDKMRAIVETLNEEIAGLAFTPDDEGEGLFQEIK